MGFAPKGDYWGLLRRIETTHLFGALRRITAHETGHKADCTTMLSDTRDEAILNGSAIKLRQHLQKAALNNIMGCVFGQHSVDSETEKNLREMVDEGFELLGAFNWTDHLRSLPALDPLRIHSRCARLVPRVGSLVKDIIEEHQQKDDTAESDFVDIPPSLQEDDTLQDDDMMTVLRRYYYFHKLQFVLELKDFIRYLFWTSMQELIFRGTDTTALLTEWTMAELLLNPQVQGKVHAELDAVVGRNISISENDIEKLPW
jgi:cytochrome P450